MNKYYVYLYKQSHLYKFLMKRVFVLLILTFPGILIAQKMQEGHLDFFGHKYYFTDTLWEVGCTNSYHKDSRKHATEYKLTGSVYTMKAITYISVSPADEINIQIDMKETRYKKTDTLIFYHMIDSIDIKDIDEKKGLKIIDGNNFYKVLGFKIYGDSVDYETEFMNDEERTGNYAVFDPGNDIAAKRLSYILSKNSICTKYVITEIKYHNKKEKRDYILWADILIKK